MPQRYAFYPDVDTPTRLDVLLAQTLQISRSLAVKYIAEGAACCNGRQADKNEKVSSADYIEVTVPDPQPLDVPAQDIPLDIVYEDSDLLVVNKPKGMVVHPAPGNWSGTLVNALLWHCGGSLSGIGGVLRPGIVHRIDKDTSGLLMAAKNDLAHRRLAQQIKAHTIEREYEAVVHGTLKTDCGVIDAPVGRHPIRRKQMAVVPNGKPARTRYQVLERYPAFTHVRFQLETGRTHQIRVHMASIGHPVAGDPLYGPKKSAQGLDGQCLHAKKLGFLHPTTGAPLCFETPLPAYFVTFLKRVCAT